jgi:hypothetical protein
MEKYQAAGAKKEKEHQKLQEDFTRLTFKLEGKIRECSEVRMSHSPGSRKDGRTDGRKDVRTEGRGEVRKPGRKGKERKGKKGRNTDY